MKARKKALVTQIKTIISELEKLKSDKCFTGIYIHEHYIQNFIIELEDARIALIDQDFLQ